MRQQFEEHPDVNFVLHGRTKQTNLGGVTAIRCASQIRNHCDGQCHLGHVSVRRSAFAPFPDLDMSEDEAFCSHMISAGHKGHLIREPLMTYVISRSVMTTRWFAGLICPICVAVVVVSMLKWRRARKRASV